MLKYKLVVNGEIVRRSSDLRTLANLASLQDWEQAIITYGGVVIWVKNPSQYYQEAN